MECLVFFKISFPDGFVDPCQFLVDDPASAYIEMSNFRVSHLSIRQADIFSIRHQGSMWMVIPERVKIGCISGLDGADGRIWVESPSIQDN